MRILSVAFPFAPVTEGTAGGAEQILRALDRSMCGRGWQSTVVAAAGSRVSGRLIEIDAPAGDIDDETRRAVWRLTRAAIEQATAAGEVDLLHFHGVDFMDYLPAAGVPALVTLHLPMHCYGPQVLVPWRDATYLNGVSVSQLARSPASMRLLGHIGNGVDLNSFVPAVTHDEYALALGRICPEKGFHHALDAARMADVPLILAGTVYPFAEHRRYFEREIVPRLDDRRRFVGAVGGAAKRQLLAHARCLLVPSLIDETSSLVAMEALGSGTPVIAFPAGALAEVVDDGQSGLLVRSAEEMASAIRNIGMIDRQTCRTVAEQRFSEAAMVEAYFALYRRILESEPLEADVA